MTVSEVSSDTSVPCGCCCCCCGCRVLEIHIYRAAGSCCWLPLLLLLVGRLGFVAAGCCWYAAALGLAVQGWSGDGCDILSYYSTVYLRLSCLTRFLILD